MAPEVRAELRSLARPTAERVARHLVAAGRLLDEDPEAALVQARAARDRAARIGAVREAAGIAAYRAGEWAEALAELRTARRITGDPAVLPVIADAERALGRPERAIELARSPEAAALPSALRVEMRIVESGARRDLGQLDAALVTLQGPDLDRRTVQPWTARLWYAYADTLLALGRTDEARDWFLATASIDEDGDTDADERLLELDGITVLDVDESGATEPADEIEPAHPDEPGATEDNANRDRGDGDRGDGDRGDGDRAGRDRGDGDRGDGDRGDGDRTGQNGADRGSARADRDDGASAKADTGDGVAEADLAETTPAGASPALADADDRDQGE